MEVRKHLPTDNIDDEINEGKEIREETIYSLSDLDCYKKVNKDPQP